MKKRPFLIIFNLLLSIIFLFSACKNSSPPLQSPLLKSEAELPQPIPSPKASPIPQEATTPPNKDFWNTSNVDISTVDSTKKLIALTFDDAPVKTLERIVSVFLHFNASHPDCPAYATLFCNGKNVTASTLPSLQAAYAAGFELGNHTQNHKRLTALSVADIRQEIEATDRILQQVDSQPLHLLRTPYGDVNTDVRQAASVPIINWLIDTLDWTGKAVDDICDLIMQQKSDGAIVLMHDGYENTVLALKRLLPCLYAAGYQAVSVSQMAKAHSVALKTGSVYIRARKH